MSELLRDAIGIHGFDRRFAHRQELLDAALAAFVERRYEDVSLNDILAAAQMSKGQFYHHFRNKEGLYLALIDELRQRKQRHMATIEPSTNKVDGAIQGSTFSRLRAMMALGLDFARAEPQLNTFGEAFLRQKGTPIYARALTVFELRNEEWIRALIEQGIVSGELRADLPSEFVAELIGIVLGNLGSLTLSPTIAATGVAADRVFDILEFGLAQSDRKE